MQILGEFQTSVRRALWEIDPEWESYRGLIICGTHSPKLSELDYFIDLIRDARVKGTPYLGICYGYQLSAIEWARNAMGIKDATSEEFGVRGTFVVQKRKDLKVGLYNGESYWNNYEVVIDWEQPKHFFISQSHPEYQSSIDNPHPLLLDFINYCKNYARSSADTE